MANTVAVRAPDPPKSSTALKVTSSSFREGGAIPIEHVFNGCGGKNVSPQLSWTGAPEGTKSFAISCFDPDAPTGSGYWHWLAFGIPGKTTSLGAGASVGSAGRNDYGMSGYGGPCPPKGDIPHRYIFTVYALDVDTIKGAGVETSGASVIFMMRGHVLATGTITGTFAH